MDETQRAVDKMRVEKNPNYASARQGAIEDEMTYQEEEEAILSILDEIYETFVISCYLTGLIILAGTMKFRQHIAPYTPAQEIVDIIDYDTDTLAASVGGN